MTGFAEVGSGQILGCRDQQEDALGFGEVILADGRRAPLAVLADGMGGHHGGAIAARLAIETFLDASRAASERTFTGALDTALLAANRAIAERTREEPRFAHMGCTLIATVVEGGVLHYVSVGDSLLWRLGSDRFERLNADHSMGPVVAAAVARGAMSQAEAEAHGSMLRSAITGRPIELVDLRSVELARDDWLLLASDGILTLAELDVRALSRAAGASADAGAQALLDAVTMAGAPEQDNCSVILIAAAPPPVNRGRRTRAVLGALAVLAGVGVVGAAGAQLLRLTWPLSGLATAEPSPRPTPATAPVAISERRREATAPPRAAAAAGVKATPVRAAPVSEQKAKPRTSVRPSPSAIPAPSPSASPTAAAPTGAANPPEEPRNDGPVDPAQKANPGSVPRPAKGIALEKAD